MLMSINQTLHAALNTHNSHVHHGLLTFGLLASIRGLAKKYVSYSDQWLDKPTVVVTVGLEYYR
jgi:hypothetical protein